MNFKILTAARATGATILAQYILRSFWLAVCGQRKTYREKNTKEKSAILVPFATGYGGHKT